MTTEAQQKKPPVQLRFDGGEIIVTPQDEDRFVMASEQAVKACQFVNFQEECRDRFKSTFLSPIHSWCLQNADKIRDCYVATQDGAPTVFVVTVTEEYDPSLDSPLSTLEIQLDDNGWSVDVLQIPACSAEDRQSFFDDSTAIQIYGDGTRASS